MNITQWGWSLIKGTTTRRWCQQVHCTPDVTSAHSSSHAPAIERPVSKHQTVSPVSKLAAVHLQDPQAVWPGQHRPQVDHVGHLQPAQPQQPYMQDSLRQAASPTAASSSAQCSIVVDENTVTSHTQPVAQIAGPGMQQRKRHKKQRQRKDAMFTQHQQQQQLKAPVRFTPCGKRDGQKLAALISQRLRKGQQVLVPAGAGMQLVRNTAMLASSRSLMLSHNSSTGLVFQPSFSTAAAMQPQQPQQRMQQSYAPAGQLQEPGTSAASGPASSSTGGAENGRSKGVMLLVSSVPEAQLRRFDQHPLIAARSTRAAALAKAMFARMCKQGFASVRAAGPEASRLAVLAAAEARSKLLGCGLDLAIVPVTEFVDIDSLAGPDGPPQYVDMETGDGQEGFGPGEELPKQFVRVTVLHLVRCKPQQPWKLLPWAVPAAQLPAARQRQQQQQHVWQQAAPMEQLQQEGLYEPQQQVELAGAGPAMLVAAAVTTKQREERDEQQRQQQQFKVAPAAVSMQGQQLAGTLENGSGSWGGEDMSADLGVLQDAVASVAAAQRLHAAVLPCDPISSECISNPTAAAAAANGSHLPAYSHSAPVAANVVSAAGLVLPHDHADVGRGWAAASGSAGALLSAEQLQVLQLQQQDAAVSGADAAGLPSQGSSCGSMAGRQSGGLLLQHKQGKKGSRQLVAAAQAGSNAPTTGRSSS